jgi:hypothetical protein
MRGAIKPGDPFYASLHGGLAPQRMQNGKQPIASVA